MNIVAKIVQNVHYLDGDDNMQLPILCPSKSLWTMGFVQIPP